MKPMLLVAFLLVAGTPAFCAGSSPASFDRTVARCIPSAPLTTVRAIVRAESDFLPLALSINRPMHTHKKLAHQPHSREEALAWTRWLLQNDYVVSVGLMQINIVDAAAHGFTPKELFDTCTNLKLGWKILTEKYQTPATKYGPGQRALLEALSLYNSGSPRLGFLNGYVYRVLAGEFGELAGGGETHGQLRVAGDESRKEAQR
jgi:type IV secretion system protein VirB1